MIDRDAVEVADSVRDAIAMVTAVVHRDTSTLTELVASCPRPDLVAAELASLFGNLLVAVTNDKGMDVDATLGKLGLAAAQLPGATS